MSNNSSLAIIVCGGRNFTDADSVKAALDRLLPRLAFVITGGANGADSLAAAWANSMGVASIVMPADWANEGRAAGFRRNQRMLNRLLEVQQVGPVTITKKGVVAFPGGKGTSHMISIATAADVRVWRPLA